MGTFETVVTGKTLVVIMGSGAGALLLILVLVIIWTRQRRRSRFDLTLEDIHNEGLSVKSAPSSRLPSPVPAKRLSCPDAFSMPMRGGAGPVLTPDHVPDFSLPTERVQPRCADHGVPLRGTDRSPTHSTALHCQHHLVGNLPPGLYSRSSSFTEDEDSFLPRSSYGRLWYSLEYDASVGQLNVTLIKVKDLPGRGFHNHLRDPYVNVFVLPDDRTCRTSKVRKKTLSPVFNQDFFFQVPAHQLKERTLRFSVYDVDKKKVRHSLGHVMVPLGDVDLTQVDTHWADLEASTQMVSCPLGDVQLGLCYQPQHEKVKITVQKVRHLKHIDMDSEACMYTRLRLFYGRKLHRTKRTGCREDRGEEVQFRESFSFSLAGKQLESCRLETCLMLTHPTGPQVGVPDVEWGRVVLGPFMYARGEQLLHWQHMLAQPRVTVTRWHALAAAPAVSHD
ncbi:synaptotagmin-1-like [Babylonia areolata]|uniref:synaptotagmin-1-like n=1 Tax=Babylonia areolata TaxID=304850 RepID=UPI003FD227D0